MSRRSISKHSGAEMSRGGSPEARRDPHHGLHERVRVLGVDQDRHGGQPGELAVEERLALHDRHARHRPDVAQAEDTRPVRADGDAAADHREPAGQLGELRDGSDTRATPGV
jgi:hypothetical protein